MSSTYSRWILPVILLLVAIVGWGAYFLSSETPQTGQTESAGLNQELQALQQNFAELRLDQESLLQENIALRALNESLQAEDDSSTGQATYPRFPGGRENYLAQRLQYASEQLRRHRRGIYQQSAASVNVSDEMTESEQQAQMDSEQQVQAASDQQAQMDSDQQDQAASDQQAQMDSEQQDQAASDQQAQMDSDQQDQAASDQQAQMDSEQQDQAASDQQSQMDSEQQVQAESDQQSQMDSDQQPKTEIVTIQPFEAENQQLREQLADQAELFEQERMNYTQRIADQEASFEQERMDYTQRIANQTESFVQERMDYTQRIANQTESFEQERMNYTQRIADQETSFEQERMNYTQRIERLSDKLAEALVSRTNQSIVTGDESTASETDEPSSATEGELVARVDQPGVAGDESVASETDESSEMSTQAASVTKQPEETTISEPTAESSQAEDSTVAAGQTSMQTDSSNDAVPAQDSAVSDTTERLEAQIDGLLEKLSTAESNHQAAMVEAREETDQLNQQLQSERRENQQLHQALQTLRGEVALLTGDLNSANERTQNMEMMTQAIVEENRRFGELVDDLQETLGLTIAERDSQISSIESDFSMIEYSTDILFESGSTVLSERGKQILKEFFFNLKVDEYAGRVINIEGHTDNVPIAGNLRTLYPTNWELSLGRAASATKFLIEQGADAKRLRPVGRGSSRPRVSNDTEAGRATNRRIEIHLAPELERIQN